MADAFANVTLSGGDPMFQPEGFTELAREIKHQSKKNIWGYTGYTFECILQKPKQAALLHYIDVLVDERFEEKQKDERLVFRGSKNQRLIDVKRSLKQKQIVCLDYNPYP